MPTPPARTASPARLRPERGPDWWSIRELAGLNENPRLRAVLGIWLAATGVAVVTGVLNVTQGWNGLELELGGVGFDVTLYPPFVVSLLLALWLGPTWGGVPIYLANLASALASGMPLGMSALFALAGVAETLMLWGSLVALRVDPDLRRGRDVAWFLGAALVAAVTASLAAILWNASHDLDPMVGQRVWRGWVIGDLLQIVFVVLPVLRLAGPRARAWLDRHFVAPPNHDFSYTRGVGLVVAAFAVLGAVVFLGVHQALGSLEVSLDARTAAGDLLLPRLREIILVMGLLTTALIVATGMFSTALARLGERQRREARIDSLTGCLNRRTFAETFEKESERSRRVGLPISVLFLDVDRFKTLNDRWGHAVGDLVLERVARRIETALRATDLLYRWGGEEFVVVMPHTPRGEVEGIAERVRAAVAASPLGTLEAGEPIATTVSVGGATSRTLPTDADALVREADRACYRAKELGRDRAVVAAA